MLKLKEEPELNLHLQVIYLLEKITFVAEYSNDEVVEEGKEYVRKYQSNQKILWCNLKSNFIVQTTGRKLTDEAIQPPGKKFKQLNRLFIHLRFPSPIKRFPRRPTFYFPTR